MLEGIDLARVGEDAAHLVQHQRIRLPAVPQFEHQFDKLIGAGVALIVGQVLGMAEQARFAVVHRGHDIPGAATSGDMVQGGDGPRHMGRLVVGGRACQPQANMLGVTGQQAENR